MNNDRTLGDFSDWAGKGAAILGLLLFLGLVRGKSWSQAHTALAGTATALYVISKL
jgi:hypothetical protein